MKSALTRLARYASLGLALSFSATAMATAHVPPAHQAKHAHTAKTSDAAVTMPTDYKAMDPYEGFNRAMFQFNQVFSGLFIEPVIYIYSNGVWSPVQHRVSNFFDNDTTVTTLPNDLLQGKVKYFFNDFWRLVINSTIGVGGLFDVAKHMGLKPHQTGFGDTLAQWGAKKSPFIVLPLLGPSTFRDAFAIPFNTAASPYPYLNPDSVMYGVTAAKEYDSQARLLPVYQAMRKAFDPYVFMRNGYFQVREAALARNQIPLSQLNSDGYSDYRHTMGGTGMIVASGNSQDEGMIVADGSSHTGHNAKAHQHHDKLGR
jgi:phospholipid-binding lipoprotein MlaA